MWNKHVGLVNDNSPSIDIPSSVLEEYEYACPYMYGCMLMYAYNTH